MNHDMPLQYHKWRELFQPQLKRNHDHSLVSKAEIQRRVALALRVSPLQAQPPEARWGFRTHAGLAGFPALAPLGFMCNGQRTGALTSAQACTLDWGWQHPRSTHREPLENLGLQRDIATALALVEGQAAELTELQADRQACVLQAAYQNAEGSLIQAMDRSNQDLQYTMHCLDSIPQNDGWSTFNPAYLGTRLLADGRAAFVRHVDGAAATVPLSESLSFLSRRHYDELVHCPLSAFQNKLQLPLDNCRARSKREVAAARRIQLWWQRQVPRLIACQVQGAMHVVDQAASRHRAHAASQIQASDKQVYIFGSNGSNI